MISLGLERNHIEFLLDAKKTVFPGACQLGYNNNEKVSSPKNEVALPTSIQLQTCPRRWLVMREVNH